MATVVTPEEEVATTPPVSPAATRLPAPEAPEGTRPLRVFWGFTTVIVAIHLLSLLALVPWFFSWTGLVLCILGHYVFGMLGITLGYHRLLAHKGFTCPKWLEHGLALLGVCTMQDSPARWVAVHRKHHQHSDETPDPHSPLVAFAWGHMGWLIFRNRETSTLDFYERYSRDLLSDPFYMQLERGERRVWIYAAHAALFFLVGLAIGWIQSGRYWGGVQFGASLLVWGVFCEPSSSGTLPGR